MNVELARRSRTDGAKVSMLCRLQISITRKEVRVKDIGDPGSFVPKQGHLYKLTDAGMRLLS